MTDPKCGFLNQDGTTCDAAAVVAAWVDDLGVYIPACDTHKEERQYQVKGAER